MMDYDSELEAVSLAMTDPDHQLAMAMRSAFEGLDTIMAISANHETVELVEANRVLVGQIITRAQLIGAFLTARQPQLKVVSRG